MLQRVGTFAQPSGAGRPNLAPPKSICIQSRLRGARNAGPFAFPIDKAITTGQKLLIRWIANKPGDVIAHRLEALTEVTSLNGRISDIRKRRTDALPLGCAAKNVNFAPIQCISTNLSYDSRSLTAKLPRGLHVEGYAPIPTTRPRPAKVRHSDRATGIESRDVMVYDRLLKSANSEPPEACRAGALDEVYRGRVSHPQLIAQKYLKTFRSRQDSESLKTTDPFYNTGWLMTINVSNRRHRPVGGRSGAGKSRRRQRHC